MPAPSQVSGVKQSTQTTGDPDILGLAADARAVVDARNRVRDPKVRGAIDVFATVAQEIIRDPELGPALSDQLKTVAATADMVERHSEEAKDTLRAEGVSSKKPRVKALRARGR